MPPLGALSDESLVRPVKKSKTPPPGNSRRNGRLLRRISGTVSEWVHDSAASIHFTGCNWCDINSPRIPGTWSVPPSGMKAGITGSIDCGVFSSPSRYIKVSISRQTASLRVALETRGVKVSVNVTVIREVDAANAGMLLNSTLCQCSVKSRS